VYSLLDGARLQHVCVSHPDQAVDSGHQEMHLRGTNIDFVN
jgi:hypothetical protein